MKQLSFMTPPGLAVALVLLLSLAPVAAGSDDLNLQAKLIWGTNVNKPNDRKLKEVDTETAKKLRGVFKWKNYYEVGRTNFSVTPLTSKKVTMSPKCDLNVQNLGKSKVAVELYGEGKMLVQKRQPIVAG